MKILSLLTILLFAVSCTQESSEAQPTTPMIHVALIFDDGPTPETNADFLAFFEKESLHVTFAHEARFTLDHPQLSKNVINAGHELANHSYEHKHAADLNDEELQHEIGGAQEAFISTLDYTPKWYWPPFIEIDERVRAATEAANVTVYNIHNLVVSKDYDTTVTADEIYQLATTNVSDGSVILFHEWRKETLEQLPRIIATLREQNCTFLTLTELESYVSKELRK